MLIPDIVKQLDSDSAFFFTQNSILQIFVARSKIDAHDGTDGTR